MNLMYIRTNKMGYNILGNNHDVPKYQIITFTVYILTQSIRSWDRINKMIKV